MNNDVVSVILPIYNVEQYLEECIESVIRQSYKRLEIILVDDGSTDNSSSICDRYAKLDSRIKVIHKENGGLSDARNKGILASTGSYIALVDSDDLIADTFVENLYNACINAQAMISICAFKKFSDLKEINSSEEDSDLQILSGRELVKRIYQGHFGSFGLVAWNKLYDRRLFEEIKYPEGRIYEDTFTTYRLFLNSNKVVLLNKDLYFYRVRPESIMSAKVTLKKVKDASDADSSVVKYFYDKHDIDMFSLTGSYFCREAIITYYKAIPKLNSDDRKEAKTYLKKIFRQTWKYCIESDMSFVKKLFYSVIYVLWS